MTGSRDGPYGLSGSHAKPRKTIAMVMSERLASFGSFAPAARSWRRRRIIGGIWIVVGTVGFSDTFPFVFGLFLRAVGAVATIFPLMQAILRLRASPTWRCYLALPLL